MNLEVVKHYQKMEKIDKKMAKNTKKRFIQKNEIVSTRFINNPYSTWLSFVVSNRKLPHEYEGIFESNPRRPMRKDLSRCGLLFAYNTKIRPFLTQHANPNKKLKCVYLAFYLIVYSTHTCFNAS